MFAACWGAFGFFGPLTVHPGLWDHGIGSRLLRPVLEAFDRWEVRQAGLFTFADSPKHLGLYQKHGFWPRALTVITTKEVEASAATPFELLAGARGKDVAGLTDRVFPGLDLRREIVAASEQGLGDTVLLRSDGELDGMAVCHCGAGSEAGSDSCYVKFGAVRPGEGAVDYRWPTFTWRLGFDGSAAGEHVEVLADGEGPATAADGADR